MHKNWKEMKVKDYAYIHLFHKNTVNLWLDLKWLKIWLYLYFVASILSNNMLNIKWQELHIRQIKKIITKCHIG